MLHFEQLFNSFEENITFNQIVDKYKEFDSKDLPERIHDEVVGAIDVTQFKNMRDLNKKIKDTFVERIKAIT